MQQVFLRWNQGQELRQALITIAIAIILADQMLAHFGGVAEDIAWPGKLDTFWNLRVAGVQYTTTRLFILGVAIAVGLGLWVWLKKTRTGMVIRAGVDDRQMVERARHQHPAHVRDRVLRRLGARRARRRDRRLVREPRAPASTPTGCSNSLVVVIIGGMGSLVGAAVGSLLLGLTTNFAAAYLPSDYTYYSIIFTFVLLAIVLAVRPLGLFGRPA